MHRLFLILVPICVLAWYCAGCSGGQGYISTQSGGSVAPSHDQLVEMLNMELARLGIDPAKQASEPPSGTDSVVFDLKLDMIGVDWPPELYFSFTEQAAGDYDMNGQVGVADLTPLGVHFGYSVNYVDPVLANGLTWWPSGDPAGLSALNWRRARVDGNHDGFITVNDITPIAQHWQENCSGYRVYITPPGEETAMLPNPQDAQSVVTIGRPKIDQQEPVRYFFSYKVMKPGDYELYVAPCDAVNSSEGPASNTVHFNVPGEGDNFHPVVDLTADPLQGDLPLAVTLVAAAQDFDGEIVLFEWDPEGDGEFEESTGVTPFLNYTYNLPAIYEAAVRVTDNDGGTAVDTCYVQVTGVVVNEDPQASFHASTVSGPLPLAVEFDASTSFDPDGEIVLYEWDFLGNGRYDTRLTDPLAQRTYYVSEQFKVTLRVTDDEGATDTFTSYISAGTSWYVREAPALAGRNPGLAEYNGKPAVACIVPESGYGLPGSVMLVLANNELGTAWQEPQEVAAEGYCCNVAAVAGQPAVAYIGKSEIPGCYSLYYRRATGIAQGNWSDPVLLDERAYNFFTLEFEIVDGRPVVLYVGFDDQQEETVGVIKYLRAADETGVFWNEPLVTYVLGDDGIGSLDLEIVNDKPAMLLKTQRIGEMDPNNRGIYYQASDAAGDSWLTAASFFTFMGTNALCVADGNPALVHQTVNDDLLFYLEYRRANDPDGTDWSTVADIVTDGLNETPLCPRMVADDERVYCCYVDFGGVEKGQIAVHSLDAAGTTWSGGEVLDPQRPDTYFGSVMRIIGGRAMCAYPVSTSNGPRIRLAVFAD